MRIKLTDGAEAARLPSWRPPAVAQLTAEAKQVVTVVLSEEMRALNATLTRTLTDVSGLRLHDVLTQDDRLLIGWAAEFAKAEGIEPEEVEKLVADLGRFRMQELTGPRAEPSVPSPRTASVPSLLLSLPVFSPREEAQARAIMFSLATTRSSLEPAFVRSLLDPDSRPARSVSLTFVQRIVAAMPASAPEGLAELNAVYVRRDGRAAIAKALNDLALPVSDLVQPSPERMELGGALLRARSLLVTPDSPWRLLSSITRNDRVLLSLLYVSQDERGGGLRAVDDVARALIALRTAERDPTAAVLTQPSVGKQRPSQPGLIEQPSIPPGLGKQRPSQPGLIDQPSIPPGVAKQRPSQPGLTDQPSTPPGVGKQRPSQPGLTDQPSIPPGVGKQRPSQPGLTNMPSGFHPPSAYGVLTQSSAAPPALAEEAPRAFGGSAIHLAAKAAVAYRSVAPQRPNTVPPPNVGRELTAYGPPPARPESAPLIAPFNLAQALGLSALVAELHTQAMRARRRKFKRRKDDAIGDTSAMLDAEPENDRDPTHAARTHARWRRVARRAQ